MSNCPKCNKKVEEVGCLVRGKMLYTIRLDSTKTPCWEGNEFDGDGVNQFYCILCDKDLTETQALKALGVKEL